MKRIAYLLSFWLLISSTTAAQDYDPNSVCHQVSLRAIEYYKTAQYKLALPSIDSALILCRKEMSADTYYTMMAAYTISLYETVPEREDSVIEKGERVRKYFENVKDGYKNGRYNELLIRLGFCYANLGEYGKAIRLYDIAIPYYKAIKGQSSQYYLRYAEVQAGWYSAIGEFATAGHLYKMLRLLTATYYGKENELYILITTNYANNYASQGSYDSAFILYQEKLALTEKVFGKQHAEYAKGLGQIAMIYDNQNRFGDAIRYYEAAKEGYEKAGFSTSNDYATILNNAAQCYQNLGNLSKAYEYLAESLKIKRKIFGHYHYEIASGVNNVGGVLEDAFDYKQALEAYRFSKEILERVRATETGLYATVLTNLGNCLSNIGKLDSAIYYLQAGLSMKEKLYGPDHLSIATALNNIASIYSDLKKFKEAEAFYKRSGDIVQKVYGQNALQLSTVKQNLALMHVKKGSYIIADSLFNSGYRIIRNFILNNTEGLSEDDKETFAQDIRLNQYTALTLRKSAQLPNDWILNSSLFYKGLLLEGSKGFIAAINNISDAALKKRAQEYLDLKKAIGQQLLKPELSRSENLPAYINRASVIERELLQSLSGFRNWKEQFNTNWKQIQSKLGKNEMAIEFIAYYQPGMKTLDSTLYAAMIIKPGITDPVFVSLFYEEDFNRLMKGAGSSEAVVKKLYRSTIKSTASQPSASDSLFHVVWKPLLPHVNGASTIYFAADGVLNNLNLAAIITPGGKRLVEDHEFIQLSSTRNIIKPAITPSFKSLQLWGGVKYDDNITTSSNRSVAFTYLPGTLTEVNEIATKYSSGRNLKTVVGNAANETAFKQMDGKSPEVLHIATHGFFFPDPSTSQVKDENRFANAANPLLRSGLALADANNNWEKDMVSSDKEDGILTAYEIADMDLSSTRLVVLSACETGLGDIKSGEGVYGLQRAFKLAGVNYLIMSLWQVPDLETKEFMQTFYSNCFKGMPIRKAFRETQLDMNKKYQPYQWAAFVLVE